MNLLLKVFLACGGVALVWKIVGDNARDSMHKCLGFLLHKFPLFQSFVKANAPAIKKILEDAEAGAEDAINEQ